MADNTKQQDNALISTEEVSTLNGGSVTAQQVQRFIAALRTADGVAVDIATGNPMPVSDAVVAAELNSYLYYLTALLELFEGGSARTIVQGFAGSLPAGTNSIGQVDPRGNVAHDGADSGNPIKVGGRARTELSPAVAQNDRVDLIADKFGRQLATVAPLDQRLSGTLNRTNTESGQIIASAASTSLVVTSFLVVNASTTVSTKVDILDETTTKARGYAVKEGGGFQLSDPNGLFVVTKEKPLKGQCGTTGADVDIFVSGYRIPA